MITQVPTGHAGKPLTFWGMSTTMRRSCRCSPKAQRISSPAPESHSTRSLSLQHCLPARTSRVVTRQEPVMTVALLCLAAMSRYCQTDRLPQCCEHACVLIERSADLKALLRCPCFQRVEVITWWWSANLTRVTQCCNLRKFNSPALWRAGHPSAAGQTSSPMRSRLPSLTRATTVPPATFVRAKALSWCTVT